MSDRPPRNLAEAYMEARPGTTPTAAEVKAIMRAQNMKIALLALAFLLMGGASIWYSATGRSAAETSAETTAAALADNRREACIEARRNALTESLGVMLSASSRGIISGVVLDDQFGVEENLARFEAADEAHAAASLSLTPEVLNSPPPEGCGPPILSPEDIPDN